MRSVGSALSSLCGGFRRASLPEGDGRIGEQKNYGDKLSNKYLEIPGFLLLAGSVIFFYKIWRKISFDFSGDVNALRFMVQFVASLILFYLAGCSFFPLSDLLRDTRFGYEGT
jgi:hypothetical protein